MRAFLAVLALLFAGCVAAPDTTGDAVDAASARGADEAWPEPEVFDWSGHVIASELEGPTHFRPTEDALWPAFQEGVMFHVEEIPEAMEVSLDWTGGGSFMIMLHSHKAGGTNAYVEHITKLDDQNPKCLRVPTADLAEGHWQVMVHSEGARNADFTLHVALAGGKGALDLEERHGHWPQDGSFEIDEHEIEACSMMPAEAADER
jgi:hypothetical protein